MKNWKVVFLVFWIGKIHIPEIITSMSVTSLKLTYTRIMNVLVLLIDYSMQTFSVTKMMNVRRIKMEKSKWHIAPSQIRCTQVFFWHRRTTMPTVNLNHKHALAQATPTIHHVENKRTSWNNKTLCKAKFELFFAIFTTESKTTNKLCMSFCCATSAIRRRDMAAENSNRENIITQKKKVKKSRHKRRPIKWKFI